MDARSCSMPVAPGMLHIIPLCFMRAATTFFQALSTVPLPGDRNEQAGSLRLDIEQRSLPLMGIGNAGASRSVTHRCRSSLLIPPRSCSAWSIEKRSESAMKRSASRKLLFPDPLGPTRNASCAGDTSRQCSCSCAARPGSAVCDPCSWRAVRAEQVYQTRLRRYRPARNRRERRPSAGDRLEGVASGERRRRRDVSWSVIDAAMETDETALRKQAAQGSSGKESAAARMSRR